MSLLNNIRNLFYCLSSAGQMMDSHELSEAKAIVQERGYSYRRYMQGFAYTHCPDLEFYKAADVLLRNGYLILNQDGIPIGGMGPINDRFPMRKPKLVISNEWLDGREA